MPQGMKRHAFLVFSILFLLISDWISAAGMGVLTLLTVGYSYFSERLRPWKIIFFGVTLLLVLLYLSGFSMWAVCIYQYLEQIGSFLRYCPFGLAFFILQGIRCVIDIYTGKIAALQKPLHIAEYLLFYPRLAMGPIQSYQEHEIMYRSAAQCSQNLGDGLGRFVLGLAKKVLLADTIGLAFSEHYRSDFGNESVVMIWVSLLAFSLELFFTVSGYGDMAKGIALCYGFQIPDSYGYPLFSGSLVTFGKSWNQSVVAWLGQIFAPLMQPKKWISIPGMMCIWGILGCWYRPGIQMLLWGLWMGLWIGLHQYAKKRFQRVPVAIEVLLFILVTFCGWAMFSAGSFSDGIHRICQLFGGSGSIIQERDLYDLKSGGMILLIAMYSATGHFSALLERIRKKPVLSKISGFLTLPVQVVLLMLSLAILVTQKDVSGLL